LTVIKNIIQNCIFLVILEKYINNARSHERQKNTKVCVSSNAQSSKRQINMQVHESLYSCRLSVRNLPNITLFSIWLLHIWKVCAPSGLLDYWTA
jgi:hypothetical protein